METTLRRIQSLPLSSLSDAEFCQLHCRHWMRYLDTKNRLWMVTRHHCAMEKAFEVESITLVNLSTEEEQQIPLADFREYLHQNLFQRLEKPLQIALTIV